MPKEDRIYKGDDWSESSADDDDPVWCNMLTQLHSWIRNPEGWEEEPETVWNAHRVQVTDIKTIVKTLEKDDQGINKGKNAGRNKIQLD